MFTQKLLFNHLMENQSTQILDIIKIKITQYHLMLRVLPYHQLPVTESELIGIDLLEELTMMEH